MPPQRASNRVQSPVVDQQKARGEAWAEGSHQRALPRLPSCLRLSEYLLEHKDYGSGGHVAVIAQHCPRLNQGAFWQSKCVLERRDHLGAPRVTDETLDVVDAQTVTGEELRCDISKLGSNEIWNIPRKDRFEAFIGDLPAHYVKAAGPGMLTRGDHRRPLSISR